MFFNWNSLSVTRNWSFYCDYIRNEIWKKKVCYSTLNGFFFLSFFLYYTSFSANRDKIAETVITAIFSQESVVLRENWRNYKQKFDVFCFQKFDFSLKVYVCLSCVKYTDILVFPLKKTISFYFRYKIGCFFFVVERNKEKKK